MRERDVERYLVERVKALGGEVRKVEWVGRRGAPDRFVMTDGNYWRVGGELLREVSFWVELKAPGEKPESHQLREHERMRARGQHVFVVDSIEAVDALLA